MRLPALLLVNEEKLGVCALLRLSMPQVMVWFWAASMVVVGLDCLEVGLREFDSAKTKNQLVRLFRVIWVINLAPSLEEVEGQRFFTGFR